MSPVPLRKVGGVLLTLVVLGGADDGEGATGAQDPAAAAGYAEAHRRLDPMEAAYRSALVASLDADNPYERKLALETLTALPVLVTGEVLPAVVRRLEETDKLHSAECASLIERLDRSYGGQGEELEYAHCNVQGGTANGVLAARLLAGRGVFPLVVARVAERPKSVEAVVDALGPSGMGPANDVAGPLGAARDPEAQLALLRLALGSTCGPAPTAETLATVVALERAAAPAVARRATLAVLRFTGCGGDEPRFAEPRRRAAEAAIARVRDPQDATIVAELRLIGAPAAPAVDALMARLRAAAGPRSPERAAIVATLGAVGPAAAPATPLLVGLLREPQGHLHGVVLSALGSIGPGAAAAEREVLAVACEDDGPYVVEALETLAQMRVRLEAAAYERLVGRYSTSTCERAGSIFMFNLGRDRECNREAAALARLARLGGHHFKEVGWRR